MAWAAPVNPYRNWQIIIPELRAFVLNNFNHYGNHPTGPEAFTLFSHIFLESLEACKKNTPLVAIVMEAMLAYCDKLVNYLTPQTLSHYQKVLNHFFTRLAILDQIDQQILIHMVQGHHPMKKMASRLIRINEGREAVEFDYTPIANLMKKILTLNYHYWLNEDDPLPWFQAQCLPGNDQDAIAQLFNPISHAIMRANQSTLDHITLTGDPKTALQNIISLPNHLDIVRTYRAIPTRLPLTLTSHATAGEIENRKLLFLFRIMDTAGLYLIHEETLRQINRSLVNLIREQSFEEIEDFFVTTFQFLKANVKKYPHTSLQCIQVIGCEVFKRGKSQLVEAFLWEAVRFGFQYANVSGVDEDWQPITNPAHLANIRVWLNLIIQEPKWCSTLLSALIINLKLTGTCVKDTDLFQRDVTELLNHPVQPIYNLAKQFTKLMPVFFNEIGAEGELRTVSTELDEHHKRRDLLIHFLRKQSHVESSNLIIDFIHAIYGFWLTLDLSLLTPFLPEEIHSRLATDGPFVHELHLLSNRLQKTFQVDTIETLLSQDEKTWHAYIEKQADISSGEKRRFFLLVKMYRLLKQKYSLGPQELEEQLRQGARAGEPGIESLLRTLKTGDTRKGLDAILTHLEGLQEVILSTESFLPREEIYYKRHIAVDIPSVYGRYSERKFDALGLTFRLESMANIYLEKLSDTINLSFITKATFIRISKCLGLYIRALRIDGITSRRLETYASLLASSSRIKGFSYTQYLDIVRGLSEGVKDIIYAYYTNIHQNNLSIIIPHINRASLLTTLRPLFDDADPSASLHKLSEFFFRDLIATTFGLQHLDNFITRIIQTLEAQKDILDEATLNLLMTYNPDTTISSLYNENRRTHNLIHLGNKGFNLMVMANDKKPVPPALIITTEIFRCWEAVKKFDRAHDDFMARLRRAIQDLEQTTNKQFGSAKSPLLLSVRSGSTMSMPGMMSTIHNVGLNEQLVHEAIGINGRAYFAWDTFRRFQQSWGMAKGMDREIFQELMNQHKKKHGARFKREFSAAAMHKLALQYQNAVRAEGFSVPDDPWQQLLDSIEMVLSSWHTQKAQEYRRLMDVSDDWGTAVIIQAMVYGNLSHESGSGVLFTAHPYRKVRRVALWGDYAVGVQGEDIVSGLVTSYPISEEQAQLDGRPQEHSLEVQFPEIYERLLAISRDLVYTKSWNPQEIEFTFQGTSPGSLYLLQTRDMITIKKKERFDVFTDPTHAQQALIGKGIGVSGSALSGKAVFNEENILQLRQQEPSATLILIRQDTVPDDIREISMSDGLLTSRGGQTSHASVVATRLEKTCVVGCRELQVYEAEGYCLINGKQIKFADPIAIDGRNGTLLEGTHPVQEEVHILPL